MALGLGNAIACHPIAVSSEIIQIFPTSFVSIEGSSQFVYKLKGVTQELLLLEGISQVTNKLEGTEQEFYKLNGSKIKSIKLIRT